MSLVPVKKHATLSDQAYQIIRNAIVINELKPQEPLIEERLSETLSISRTPLRTALHRLVDEGLVEVSGKNLVVSRMTQADVAAVQSVRLRLELLVMEELQNCVTPALLNKLRTTIQGQAQLSMDTAEDFVQYIHLDCRFHTTLAKATGNKYLYDLVGRINTHSNRCLMLSTTLHASRSPAIQEHTAILTALEQEDYPQAVQAMQDHITAVSRRFISISIP